MTKAIDFKKGSRVKFSIGTWNGPSKGKGVVTKAVPKDAVAGACRLTVKDGDGKVWHPYPSQCVAV